MKVTDKITITNEDNMRLMKRYPDNYFDLAIVDPPYGIGDTWSKSRKDTFYQKGKMHSYQNNDRPSAEYYEELKRVSKNQIIWGGNYFTDHLDLTNSWIIWDKQHGVNAFMSDAELAWTSFKKVMRIARYLWDGARKCEKMQKVHPHQKPVKLYEWILENYAEEGDKILDTHLGSGSIAIACHNRKFELTACELDRDYYKAAIKRIEQHIAQLTLF